MLPILLILCHAELEHLLRRTIHPKAGQLPPQEAQLSARPNKGRMQPGQQLRGIEHQDTGRRGACMRSGGTK